MKRGWMVDGGGGGGGGEDAHSLTGSAVANPAWSAQPRGLILTQNPLGTKSQVMLR